MSYLHALLLGIVQGLTEFIPVSSTAHLLIAEELLGIPADEKTFAFSVIIQLGTVLALIAFFWRDILEITVAYFSGIKNRNPFENLNSRLGWLVIVATIPALTAGYLLNEIVQERFSDPLTQAGSRLLFTAVLLAAVEYFDNRKRSLDSMNWMDALTVGFFQILAIFPGASRSGSTIAGGMIRGLDRPSAAKFAFLMSAPILLAAGIYEIKHVIDLPGTTQLIPYLAVGFVSAAVVGWVSIKWLMAFISRHSLYYFAAYCAIAGALVLILK